MPLIDHNTLETIILIAISLLGLFMKRHFDKRDKSDNELKVALGKLEDKKDMAVGEWREEVNANFCTIKTNTQRIADELREKVPYEHCTGRMDRLDERLRKVGA